MMHRQTVRHVYIKQISVSERLQAFLWSTL